MNITPEQHEQAKKIVAKVNGSKGGATKWQKLTPEGREIALSKLQEGRKKYLESKKQPTT